MERGGVRGSLLAHTWLQALNPYPNPNANSNPDPEERERGTLTPGTWHTPGGVPPRRLRFCREIWF
eukprot:8530018-Pyramimonas_sp.AAC.2